MAQEFKMRNRLICSSIVCVLFWSIASQTSRCDDTTPIPIAELNRTESIDFEKEILPIFRKNCLACHNATDAQGELVLETPQTILKGGSQGPAVVASKSAESLLLQLASHQEEPVMPPADNDLGASPLTSEQLGLIQRWINEGAKGEVTGKVPIVWQPIAADFRPILATTMTGDGQYVACGRANRLDVYHLPTRQFVNRLVDPNMAMPGEDGPSTLAHRNLIHSLAFNPEGNLLASGGFRTVKLWRRSEKIRLSEVDLVALQGIVAVDRGQRWVAVGEASGTIQILDLDGEREPQELKGHQGAITGLVFSDDSTELYSGAADKVIYRWNVASGQSLASVELPAVVGTIALMGDARQLVTGTGDAVIRIWSSPAELEATENSSNESSDASETEETKPAAVPVREIAGHEGNVTSLATVPGTMNQFVSGSLDGSLRHWNADDGAMIRQLDHGAPVLAVAVAADGKRFVTVGEDAVVKLWNAEDGELVAELAGDYRVHANATGEGRRVEMFTVEVAHYKGVSEAAEKRVGATAEAIKTTIESQTAAEKELSEKVQVAEEKQKEKTAADDVVAKAHKVVETSEKNLAAAEAATKQAVQALDQLAAQLKETIVAAEAQPDNQELIEALAVVEKEIQQIKVATEQTLSEKLKKAHELANQSAEAATQQVEQVTKELADANEAVETAKEKKQDAVDAVATAKSDDEKAKRDNERAKQQLVTAEELLKNQETEKVAALAAVQSSRAPISTVHFSADNQYLAIGDHAHRVQFFDATTGRFFQSLEGHTSHIRHIHCISLDRAVSLDAAGKKIEWDLQPDWVLERTIGDVEDGGVLSDRVLTIDFSPDGKLLATGSGEPTRSGHVKIWQVEDGELLRAIENAHSDTVFGVSFSPDGQQLASAGADRLVQMFRMQDGQLLRSFDGHTHHALAVDWQANGRRIISAGADNAVKVWDPETGEQERNLGGFGKEVTSISFVGVGSQAVTTSGDSQIRLHNTDDGSEIRKLEGASDFVYTAAISANGQSVAAGGSDGVLRFWNLQSGELQGMLVPPEAMAAEEK